MQGLLILIVVCLAVPLAVCYAAAFWWEFRNGAKL